MPRLQALRIPFVEPEDPSQHHSNLIVLDKWAEDVRAGSSLPRCHYDNSSFVVANGGGGAAISYFTAGIS